MKIELIKKETAITSLWSGGQTREYTLYPKTAVYANRDFAFRISSATIETLPSVFTKFEGYRRYLVMLDGDLHLNLNGVDQRYKEQELFTFQSTDVITSYSMGTDFNLMLHHAIVDEVVEVTNQSFQTNQPFICLFALQSSNVFVNDQVFDLQTGDCLWITNPTLQHIAIELEEKTIVAYWSIPQKTIL